MQMFPVWYGYTWQLEGLFYKYFKCCKSVQVFIIVTKITAHSSSDYPATVIPQTYMYHIVGYALIKLIYLQYCAMVLERYQNKRFYAISKFTIILMKPFLICFRLMIKHQFLPAHLLNTIFLFETISHTLPLSSKGKVLSRCVIHLIQFTLTVAIIVCPLYVYILALKPFSFPFILITGGAVATLATKQLISLTCDPMIAKDTLSGDSNGRGNPQQNPQKIDLAQTRQIALSPRALSPSWTYALFPTIAHLIDLE